MLFNLGTLGIFDTTKTADFANSLGAALIQSADGTPADNIDRAIFLSQLQKAFRNCKTDFSKDAIHYFDAVFPDNDLRSHHAVYHGHEVGISVKVTNTYPNICDYDRRPDDLPGDKQWTSLRQMRSLKAYYQKVLSALDEEISAREELIVALHPNQKIEPKVSQSVYIGTPSQNTTLFTLA